ncbi:MAG: orotidine-5'-phosphate decarboxylase [Promethearchaeota archaeon]
MSFIENLVELIRDKRSVVCLGLDPRLDGKNQIPEFLKLQFDNPNDIIFEFNKELIDNVSDIIPLIKPQIAFYEKYDAFNALKETIKYARKKDLLVILDSKRNDIGSTSEAYAFSMFKNFKADACTINAYFGIDGVKPFLNYKEKGIFVLVKTSNPSSGEFQDLFSVKLENIDSNITEIKLKDVKLKRNYIHMAELVRKWCNSLQLYDGYYNLGVVVGATYPNELKSIRNILPNSFILIPGYGAQGATADDIKYGFNENGLGGIVNSSRGIMFAYVKRAYPPERFGTAAREEILEMNKEINNKIDL